MKPTYRIAALLLSLVLTLSCVGVQPTRAADSADTSLAQLRELVLEDEVSRADDAASADADEPVLLIVELQGGALLEISGAQTAALAAENTGLARRVEREQEAVIAAILAIDPDAEILHRYDLLLNGLSVRTSRRFLADIAALEGVASAVIANEYRRAVADTQLLGAAVQTAQRSDLDGRGTVVAVIDSGIDYTHKDMVISPDALDDVKLGADEVSALIGELGLSGAYFTEKVPYGYNYADHDQNVIDTAEEDSAYNHGMHVAGIIGANCQSEDELASQRGVRGAAPECQLLAMKIFSNTPNVAASEADIIAAIEDSVALGADVINLSIGLSAGFRSDENGQQKAIHAAREAGVIVVAAAGNGAVAPYQQASDTRPHPSYLSVIDTGTVAEPGLSEDTIQVASMDNSGRVVYQLTAHHDGSETKLPYVLSDFDVSALTDEYELVYCGLGRLSDLGNRDLTGKVALIERGEIGFDEKKLNAQQRGAVAVILFNSDGNDTFLDYTATSDELTIPVLFLRHSDGAALRTLCTSGATVTFSGETVILPLSFSGISYFSSWGPTSDLSFKPDVAAVGGYVWSTIGGNDYQTMSGTSMATPNVAGMAALMLQQLAADGVTVGDPTAYVKTALMNTAQPISDESGALYSPRAQGAGAAMLADALRTSVTVTCEGVPYMELKTINAPRTLALRLCNTGSESVAYRTAAQGVTAAVTFSERSVTLAPGETKLLYVTIDPSDCTENSFVEGFVRLLPVSDETLPALCMPFLGFYGDWGGMKVMDDPMYPDAQGENNSVYGATGLYTAVSLGLISQTLPLGGGEHPEYNAINPADSASYCNVLPGVSFLRNAKNVTVEVTDDDGALIRTLSHTESVRKEVPIEQSVLCELDYSWMWTGTRYNKLTGTSEPLPEGQYYITVRAFADAENAPEQQLTLPVKIDQTSPTLEAEPVFTDGQLIRLHFTAQDLGVVDSGIKNFVFLLDGEAYRDASGSAVFTLEGDEDNCYVMTLRVPEGTERAVHTVDIGVTDHANNMGAARVLAFDHNFSSLHVSTDKLVYAPGEPIGLSFTWDDASLAASAVSYRVYADSFAQYLTTFTDSSATLEALLLSGSRRLIVQALDVSGRVLDTSCAYFTVTDEGASFYFTDLSGETLENGALFTASLRVTNLGSVGSGATLLLCLYDGQQRLVDFAAAERVVAPGTSELLSASLTVPQLGQYTARLMVWDSIEGMESLLASRTIQMN